MPIFEYLCLDCGKTSEILIAVSDDIPYCNSCSGRNLKKLLSPHSSMSGPSKNSMPSLETPHAVDHLQAKLAAQGLEAAVAEIKYNNC
jgi:putative FmdB family regulatory protein